MPQGTTPRNSPREKYGLTVQRTLGGSSGPLYGAFLARAAARLRAGSADDPATWAEVFLAGCAAITDLGGAHRGDRTMLDALVPAAEAFRDAIREGKAAQALRKAADAAAEGARETAKLAPRHGRSSYLGERALGHVDPGAEAVAVWLVALAESVA
jgi:triose/dihydroxyacetone kinase / FAD-AMP lyase (cyclizing)